MYTGIYFLIEAIFYSVLLLIVYFRKQVYKSKENKVYSILVGVSFFELLLEFVLDIVGPMYQTIPKVSYLIARFYSLVVELWITILLCYVLFVCLNIKKRDKYIPIVRNTAIVLMIIFATLNFILPLNFKYDGYIAYTYGPSVSIIYISAFLYSFIGIVALIRNIKNIKDRRFFPILLFLLVGGIASYIQYMNPGLLLATPIHAFITFIMYFTIENPDVKMIEEYHKAKEIADNANEDKTMFLYNMTNDIRAITQDINNDANNAILELDSKKIDKDYMSECLRGIKENTARFTTMTNEILDVSNMDGASIRVYDEKYNIRLILDSLISIYKKKCNSKNISFRSNISSDIPKYLYGDGINLKKILDILLDNSVKYTDKGYVELDVNTIIKNDMVRLIINVEDSGIGIDSEKLGSLFVNKKDYKEENYDLNDTLYNVKKIITMMGGTIIPNSTYGKGTNMKIILDQKLVIDNNKLDEYEKRIDKKDILYVGSNGKLINRLFKNKEVDLEIIELGKEALDKIRGNKRYDLILLEDDIKPLSGFVIMKKLLMIKSFNTKVILLTGNNEYKDSYKEYGFSDVILKPIDEEIFNNIIDKYLK